MFAAKGDIAQCRHGEGALKGVYNVFNAINYCFLTEKRGSSRSDRVTSPVYEPRVHLRFEI